MTNAQLVVLEGGGTLEEMLSEYGIDTEGGKLIPVIIPIKSLSDVPTALKNLAEHADGVAEQITEALEAEDEPSPLEELEHENAMLRAKLEGVEKAMSFEL